MDPVLKAQQEAEAACRNALENTPGHLLPYLVFIKQNKRVGGTRKDPIYASITLPYMKVDGRIKEAQIEHKIAGEKLSIRTEFLTLENNVILCQATVTSTMHGETVGTAQVNFGGVGVDANSPTENAETSAWGRALGAMGYGLLGTGMASADEIIAAMEMGETPARPPKPTRPVPNMSEAKREEEPDDIPDTPRGGGKMASDKQRHYLVTLLEGAGVVLGHGEELLKAAFPRGLTMDTASKHISDIKEMDTIPPIIFAAYVKMLREKVGLQREAVELYLTTSLEAESITSLSSEQQRSLIGWITMAQEELV